MWADGLTSNAIAHALGCSAQQVRTEMSHMRKAGWDLPYRHLTVQGVALCAEAGTKGTGGGRPKAA